MFPWERMLHDRYAEKHEALLSDQFTPAQVANLRALRDRLGGGDAVEFVIDRRRLAFVRWLVDHGRMGEVIVTSTPDTTDVATIESDHASP